MTKILDGRELAGFIKRRQSELMRGRRAKLVIIRDSDDAVIRKYVELKKRYGEEIGVEVVDEFVDGVGEEKHGMMLKVHGSEGVVHGVKASGHGMKVSGHENERLVQVIHKSNDDKKVDGIIVQLPLKGAEAEKVLPLIAAGKDVDGLSGAGRFDSATATAINWLLAGHNIELVNKKIAVVGRGRLVGRPLIRMWENSGLDVTVFRRGDDLSRLRDFEVIVTATGQPHLIKNEMVAPGAVVVDAGTASEDGVLVGDLDEEVRGRNDLLAITPKIGGVGPLTVAVLFDNVITAGLRR